MRTVARLFIAAAAVAAILSSTGCSMLLGDVPTDRLLPSAPKSRAAAPPKVVPAANTAPSSLEATAPTPVIKSVDRREAEALVTQGALLVDLRDAKAYKKEHIEGATSLPMSEFAKKAKDWPQDAPVVLYCENGRTARTARSWLARRSFTQVFDVRGGLEAWDGELVGTSPRQTKPTRPKLYYFHADY